MENLSPWLPWAVGGILLMIVEVFTLSLVLLFFGAAAIVVSVAIAAGLRWPLAADVALFAALGTAFTLVFRSRLKQTLGRGHAYHADASATITVDADIPAGREGKVMYQGSPWTAVNASHEPLIAGSRARIERTEGNKLILKGLPS